VVKLRQNLRIVSVFGSLNQEVGVVIREAKQLLGTNQGSGNRAACVDWLECIRDDTRLYQFRDAVSDHTGVNAEILTIPELRHDGLRNGAYSNLQDGAIGYKLADVSGDPLLGGPDSRCRHRQEWPVTLDGDVDACAVQLRPGPRPGNLAVNFGNHGAGIGNCRTHVIARDSEGPPPVIRYPGLKQDDVAANALLCEMPRQLGHMDRIDFETAVLDQPSTCSNPTHTGVADEIAVLRLEDT